MRIPFVIFASAVLLASYSTHAQTASASPCGKFSGTVADKDGIFTDAKGVNFKPYIQRMYRIVQSSWQPLIPKEANPPFNKTGEVAICFKILPSGQLMDGGMLLEGRSGDEALDRAAWGAIQTSLFPPLPAKYKEPYLTIRLVFMYNVDQNQAVAKKLPYTRKPQRLPTPPNLPTLINKIRGNGSKS